MVSFTPKQRLKICIVGQLLLLIAEMNTTALLANKESKYYIFGPSEDLIVISVKMDTWLLYGILLVYILVFRVCKVFVQCKFTVHGTMW